jgi:hypothetical protein
MCYPELWQIKYPDIMSDNFVQVERLQAAFAFVDNQNINLNPETTMLFRGKKTKNNKNIFLTTNSTPSLNGYRLMIRRKDMKTKIITFT